MALVSNHVIFEGGGSCSINHRGSCQYIAGGFKGARLSTTFLKLNSFDEWSLFSFSVLRFDLKVGRIDCDSESSFCKDLGIYPHRTPRIFVYSYIKSNEGSLVEYSGDIDVKSLKGFCQEHFPRFSQRVNLKQFDFSSSNRGRLPTLMLLSTKKETPVIWRVLSGLFRKLFNFYDAEVF